MKNVDLKKINYLIIFLIITLYSSLILGFYFNENTSGGALYDYQNQKLISERFANNFFYTLLNFNKEPTRHSPVLIIILSLLEKFKIGDYIIRLINLHFLILIIYFFYKCLKIKFKYTSNSTLILISSVIFLSPIFRSLAIWPDSRMYGVLFFILSIYYFLKFSYGKNFHKKYKYSLINTFFLSISSYFSPNFCIFFFFYIFYFLKFFKLSKYSLKIILLNLILGIPAIYYVFFLKIYFFLWPVSGDGQTFISFNPANKIIIISSLFLFYYFPFLFVTNNSIKINLKKIFIALFIFLISVYFFNYKLTYTGGGIFFKLSNIIFGNNLFLFFISFFGIVLLIILSNIDLKNFFLIFIIFLNNPQLEIYHKYYDPILFVLFFTLFNINFVNNLLKKNILIFYLFYSCFLFINFLR
jgi:hypothetical protein